jgi:hypothetical protein
VEISPRARVGVQLLDVEIESGTAWAQFHRLSVPLAACASRGASTHRPDRVQFFHVGRVSEGGSW